jgi:divalent metal cation (Fe/Co/Zn/Cd) transporter
MQLEGNRRADDVTAAIRWCGLSVAWAVLVGAASVVAGALAASIALVGFGADSILDGTASAVLVWRFRAEIEHRPRVAAVERRAAQAIGVVLLAIATYLVIDAANSLAGHKGPDRSMIGLVLTSASMFVLPVLALAKLRLAGSLSSSALRGDGVLSAAGAALAAATLIALVLNSAVGWWWTDSVAALFIAAVLVREGWALVGGARRPAA